MTSRAAACAALFTDEERKALISLRRDLHAHPELSWTEQRTQATLTAALARAGITDVKEMAGTGLVATIPGTDPGAPYVALRGDIDALPITEETGLPFASKNPGVMHACGHDMHATWTVAAGMLLKKKPARSTVRLILQPAEEVGEGAMKFIEGGALDGVAMIFGAHVDWRFPTGELVATPGPLAASTDTFEITFHGKGGHGARPQDAIDPIIGLGAFIMEAQTLVSRRLDPGLPGVVTVGVVMGGSASNVIPERARCAGTIRATTPAARTLLCEGVKQLAQDIAGAHRLRAEVALTEGTPPLVNSARAAAVAQRAAGSLLGEDALKRLAMPNMGGEDFAFYVEKLDGCFMRIGTVGAGKPNAGVHTPRFDPDEDAIYVAAAVMAECARGVAGA